MIEPAQVTPPLEHAVLAKETVKLSGACPPPLTEKNPPLGVSVYAPEPEVVTCTEVVVPVKATGLGLALSDCDRPGMTTSSSAARRKAIFLMSL